MQVAPFSNFWFAAVRYQILRGISDTALSKLLVVDDKTVPHWRDCIDSVSLIESLIAVIDGLAAERRVGHVPRIRTALERRRVALMHGPVRTGKKGKGLPSPETFAKAVQHSVDTVIVSALQDESTVSAAGTVKPTRSKLARARQIATNLVAAYCQPQQLDFELYRIDLHEQLAELAVTATRMSLLRARAYFPAELGVDGNDLQEFIGLGVRHSKSRVNARSTAKSYTSALYRKIAYDDKRSESTMLTQAEMGWPLSPEETLEHYQRDLLRLHSLIEFLARIYERPEGT